MKIEINLKIILLGILFFVLKQIDIYMMFLVFIIIHEMSHLAMGMIVRITSKSISNQSLGRIC